MAFWMGSPIHSYRTSTRHRPGAVLQYRMIAKIGLSKEDIPAAANTGGAVLPLANAIPPAAFLVLSLLTRGLEA